MYKFTISAAVAALLAGPALAGGLGEPAPTPVVPAPAPAPMAPSADWSGFYLGASAGQADIEISDDDGDYDEDGTFYGLHAGYNYDMGSLVLGGEVEYVSSTFEDTATSVGDVEATSLRLKGRVGYDLGSFLPYVTAGVATIDSDDVGYDNENGYVYGLGADFAVTPSILVGAEFLRNEFDDIGLEGSSMGLRASFKF